MSAAAPPRKLRWAIRAGCLLEAVPDFPGRDTLQGRVRRFARGFDVEVTEPFGPRLHYTGNPAADANTLEPLLMRWARPTLAPILEAALPPGGCFADAGANVGVYSLWAAACVGPAGRVFAFEPVPSTREWLRRNAERNGLDWIETVPQGLGSEPGHVRLHTFPGTSGRSSRYQRGDGEIVDVEVATLDAFFAEHPPPQLLKIDVEGMELEVLRGARALLSGDAAPLVVFEAQTGHFEAAGTSYREVLDFLASCGLDGWSLGRGLCPEPPGAQEPGSPDVLAARADLPAHQEVLRRLSGVRFRDQGTASHGRTLHWLRERLGTSKDADDGRPTQSEP